MEQIYVLCPADFKTGGTELLHQLAYELNESGLNANIVYIRQKSSVSNTPREFQKYIKSEDNIVNLHDILDSKENIFIVPETFIYKLRKFKKIKKVIWWLSVDNYTQRYENKNIWNFKSIRSIIKEFILKKDIANSNLHLVQSEYARDYLEKKGLTNIKKLSDYLNETYLTDINLNNIEKKDIVLYNPKKGYEFTQKLIKTNPSLNWQPIENLTTEEVRDLLLQSKVYVDFGNHPGKDRFPREAAMSGCCIITGKKGSAKFYEDVSIPDEYKFEQTDKNIQSIINKISSCLNDYEELISDFQIYREVIKNERKEFEENIRDIFL